MSHSDGLLPFCTPLAVSSVPEIRICHPVQKGRYHMNSTNEQMDNLKSFLLETFAFTEEQTAAIDKKILMSQELLESIIERCNKLGSAADKIFYRLLKEYPEQTEICGAKIEKEMEERCPAMEIPEETPEELQASWERSCARIREEFGENAIQ